VPTQVVVKNLADATDQARRIGYPVVLKAEHGTKGERVFADLRNDEELARSFAELRSLLSNYRMKIRILVEKHIEGNVYRMEVVGGRFFDAYHMIPAAVTGDGIHSIRELIAAENDHPSRMDQGFIKARYRPLRLGSAENLMLQKQALSADSVPEAGQHVRLSANSNWSAGGTFKRLGDAAHPDNIRLTDTIAAMLGIDIAGIDLISKDIGKSFMEEPLTFIEVNHSPYIASFTDDRTGETLDNGPRLLERLASGLAYGDVPVILVTESPQAGTIAEAISGLLVDEGRRPGRIVDNHVQVNGLPAGVVHSYIADDPALLLLRRPDVGSVIVQRDLARMADSGIGSGGCDIAVVTDTAIRPLSSPVWAQGINSDTVTRLLAKYSRTGVVLCVDDVDAAKRSESIAGQRCVFVTSDPAAATFLRESDKTVLSTDEQHINQSAHKSLRGLKAGLVVQAVNLLLDQIHKG
jgi:cyanophycin synthetase